MNRLLGAIALVAILTLVGCGSRTLPVYTGPEVTMIVVQKADRKMYLMHGDQILETYRIDLGFSPIGHKQFERDGKTPEGVYTITHHNARSQFHLSLGISYPNDADRAFAKSQMKEPGGDIFIHGGPRRQDPKGKDWTAGCISVSNREVEQIWSMVRDGTQIIINP
jgi:murein L,D-transpeptidase YafK